MGQPRLDGTGKDETDENGKSMSEFRKDRRGFILTLLSVGVAANLPHPAGVAEVLEGPSLPPTQAMLFKTVRFRRAPNGEIVSVEWSADIEATLWGIGMAHHA